MNTKEIGSTNKGMAGMVWSCVVCQGMEWCGKVGRGEAR